MRSPIKTVVRRRRRGRRCWSGSARAPRPSCASSRRSKRSPISAGRSGGDRVDVTSLSRGYQDPHFVEAKPSLVLALNRADALVYVGPRSGDRAGCRRWCSRRATARIQRGQPGNIDASSAIRPEDVPERAVRSAARDGRHPPARQPALLDPAQERARHRAPARRAAHRARRGGRGDVPGASWRSFEAQLAAKEKEWESRGRAAARHAHRHVPQELVVRRALARAGGGRLHRAQARHPADREPHRAARRADEEVGRAAGDRRVVLPEHDGALRRRQRPRPPGLRARPTSARRPRSRPTSTWSTP